ncbi:MAG: nuclear transport factor 2 family protein [Ginsengibacter sp.]
MNLPRAEILKKFDTWVIAWNAHDLDGVMEFMHENVVFQNWNGNTVSGKSSLAKSWAPWFLRHGNFKFIQEDFFIDEQQQKMTFTWQLEWLSLEKKHLGKHEVRKGVDVLYLQEGNIIRKNTYSKTNILIDAALVNLNAD